MVSLHSYMVRYYYYFERNKKFITAWSPDSDWLAGSGGVDGCVVLIEHLKLSYISHVWRDKSRYFTWIIISILVETYLSPPPFLIYNRFDIAENRLKEQIGRLDNQFLICLSTTMSQTKDYQNTISQLQRFHITLFNGKTWKDRIKNYTRCQDHLIFYWRKEPPERGKYVESCKYYMSRKMIGRILFRY